MQRYQSFIRFLHYIDVSVENIDSIPDIGRLKKIANAEFALADKGMVGIDGLEYTKDEVWRELDSPDFLFRLQCHLRIWSCPSLLNFIENEKLDIQLSREWQVFLPDEDFVVFVSPYFAGPFNNAMKVLLSRQDMEHAAVWMYMLRMVYFTEQDGALQHTRIFLDESIRLFRNLNDRSYMSHAEALVLWRSRMWPVFINALPDSMLYYVDELATEIINFTVRIEKKDRKLAFQLSDRLRMLSTVNYSLGNLIAENHKVFKRNYSQTTLWGRIRSSPTYTIIIILFVIIRIIAAIGDGCVNNRGVSDIQIHEDFSGTLDSLLVDKDLFAHIRQAYPEELQNRAKEKPASVRADFGDKPLYIRVAASDMKLTPIRIENELDYPVKVWFLAERGVQSYNIESGSRILLDADSVARPIDFVLNLTLAGYTVVSRVDSLGSFQLLELSPVNNPKALVPEQSAFSFLHTFYANDKNVSLLRLRYKNNGIRLDIEGPLRVKSSFPLPEKADPGKILSSL